MRTDKLNNIVNSSKFIFITGGTKSGKSEFAEYIARKSNNLTYVALSEKRPEDPNWQNKIAKHRNRRPKEWKVIETTDLLSIINSNIGPLLIDSIGGFVMESINMKEDDWLNKMDSLIDLIRKRNSLTIIVGEQVGWGLVSEYKIGNTYIERSGELQKKLTKISQDNWLAINGRAIKIDDISFEIPL